MIVYDRWYDCGMPLELNILAYLINTASLDHHNLSSSLPITKYNFKKLQKKDP